MTELYIDGYPVDLPEDFEVDYYAQNPLFTKNGEYTYDLDISLKSKNNARIYKHIHRSHSENYPSERSAILISNGQVITSGTEILLSIENDVAKIQITSGNSELNYLSGGSKKMKDLNLGSIASLTEAVALDSLNYIYPDRNFVCTPAYISYEETENGEEASTSKIYNFVQEAEASISGYVSGTQLCAQPYLLYYISKVCEVLGYTVSSNVLLESDRFKRMIIVNGYTTLNFNEMVPNWDVDTFLSEVEKFCNVIFVVNQLTKDIRIMNVASFYEDSAVNYIPGDKVLSEYEKNFDVDESLYILYNNVAYSLPSSTRYDYMSLTDDLIALCETITVSGYRDLYNWLYGSTNVQDWNSATAAEKYNKLYILHVTNLNLDFVIVRYQYGSNTLYDFKPVNYFKNVVDEDSDNEVEFKIVPADVVTKSWLIWQGNDGYRLFAPVPIIRNMPSTDQEVTADNGLNQYISEGVPEDSVPDKMFVATYDGVQGLMRWDETKASASNTPNHVYPYTCAYPYYSMYRSDLSFADSRKVPKFGEDSRTLALKGPTGLYDTLYNLNINVKTDTEYVKNFLSDKILNPLQIFILDNKRYYCKQLKYKIQASGLNKQVEGTFYPM